MDNEYALKLREKMEQKERRVGYHLHRDVKNNTEIRSVADALLSKVKSAS